MTGLCRILTAVTLVVHLMVGCCTHHAHGCEGDLSPVHSQGTHGGECSHATHGSECSDDHSDHGMRDCQGATCSFVSASRTVADSFVLRAQAFVMVLLDDQLSPAGFSSEQCSLSSGRLLLPVRLHLANQVLLI